MDRLTVRPFFLRYGAKWAAARDYGPPRRPNVIEPFAGSAGYAVYWEPPRVTLVERDPLIVALWRWLQRVPPHEIMAIPTDIDSVDELPARFGEEARWLVGFWLSSGLAHPAKERSSWGRNERYRSGRFWSQNIRRRIAGQVGRIRHWRIIEGGYERAPEVAAHWFVDPPYAGASGCAYSHNEIDRMALAQWCRDRRGHVTVCEAAGATWLPFEPLNVASTPRDFAAEAVFEFENDATTPREEAAGQPGQTLASKASLLAGEDDYCEMVAR
jgi:hypothetical protein